MSASRFILTIVIAFFAAFPAGAATRTVGCPGATGTFDHTTISAALDALGGGQGHSVEVAGDCVEYVMIRPGFNNLTLSGTPGTTLTDPGTADPASPVLDILARDVRVVGMMFRGVGEPVPLVRVSAGSASFEGCTVEGSGADGLFVLQQGRARIIGTTVQRNGRAGVRAGVASFVNIGDTVGDSAPNLIQQNKGPGVGVHGLSLATIGRNTQIRENNGHGISVSSAHVYFCCESGVRRIEENLGAGIYAEVGATVVTQGPLLIANNGSAGVALRTGSSASFGVWPAAGPLVIRENGGSGFNLQRNASLHLGAVLVENNAFRGITVGDNSSVYLYGSTIRGNAREGILAYSDSVVRLGGGNTVKGNGLFDLVCSNALGDGVKEDVGKMFCPGFGQSPMPEPGNPDAP